MIENQPVEPRPQDKRDQTRLTMRTSGRRQPGTPGDPHSRRAPAARAPDGSRAVDKVLPTPPPLL